jgi:enamine deaminase RidA (YjgF/YER057c/UK114 family)
LLGFPVGLTNFELLSCEACDGEARKNMPATAFYLMMSYGCSDLFVEVFGDRGRHARCAVGMSSLPYNMTVEIEAIVEVV